MDNVIILGLGVSGKAALELALSRGIRVKAFDEKKSVELSEYTSRKQSPSVEIQLGDEINYSHKNCSLIVASPGIPDSSPLAKFAKSSGLPLISEIEFAAQISKKPLIAITGTNGKTTTTELTAHILNSIGLRASASGNTGFSLSEAVLNENLFDCHVVELSSFQLEKSPILQPSTATLLNISSDHMDRYASLSDYETAKFEIFRNMKTENSIINLSLLEKYKTYRAAQKKPLIFSIEKNELSDIFTDNGFIRIRNGSEIEKFTQFPLKNLQGEHNAENVMAAILLVKTFIGQDFFKDKEKIIAALQTFKLGRHRMEIVAEQDGITYVNDSKATNPDSTIAAINVFEKGKNILIILGGLDKEMGFKPLLEKKKSIKKAYLIGSCKEKLNNLLKNHIDCALFRDFEDAVNAACDEARPGDALLLSPSCASMDMFKNYQERGNKFIDLIKRRLSK
jgi:UDP-N-acetylmuramoylalanine--D-glutamate ligase